MIRSLFAAVLVAGSAAAAADDKKDPPPTWVHEALGFDVRLVFGQETVVLTALSGDNGAVVTGTYTTDKAGVVKMKVTKVDEKGSFPDKPAVGAEMTFKWKVDGQTAKLSDFDYPASPNAKEVMDGEYRVKTK